MIPAWRQICSYGNDILFLRPLRLICTLRGNQGNVLEREACNRFIPGTLTNFLLFLKCINVPPTNLFLEFTIDLLPSSD